MNTDQNRRLLHELRELFGRLNGWLPVPVRGVDLFIVNCGNRTGVKGAVLLHSKIAGEDAVSVQDVVA